MVIGGLQKFSLADFPGLISAIVFTRGCGFRCPYCHNPELVDPPRYADEIPMAELDDFLRSRTGKLHGVVVTGGEPTVHEDLPAFLGRLKDLGYEVKLDTNGTNPRMLQGLLTDRLVDFVAMDIKAPPALYEQTVNAPVKVEDILYSIELIRGSGLPHEFRTTWVPALLTEIDIRAIAQLVKGCDCYILQPFRPGKMLDSSLEGRPPRDDAQIGGIVEAATAAGFQITLR
jgi:pyruvate formate lyase activating enzyme